MRFSSSGRFDAAVSCYGSLSYGDRPRLAGQLDPIEALRTRRCPVLDIVAGKDLHNSPASHVSALVDLPGIPVVAYPAVDHGFVHDADRPEGHPHESYEVAAAAPFRPPPPGSDRADAWARIAAFVNGMPHKEQGVADS
jgi:dienelactone hydrolase